MSTPTAPVSAAAPIQVAAGKGKKERPIRHYRLMAGSHCHLNPDRSRTRYLKGMLVPSILLLDKIQPNKYVREYQPGEVVPKKKSFARGPQKPIQIPAGGAGQALTEDPDELEGEELGEKKRVPLSPDDLSTFDAMTIEELREYAKSEEIPIKGAKTKEDIIAILKQAI